MNNAIVKGREAICRSCPTPCEASKKGRINHADPEAACPLAEPRWRAWREVREVPPRTVGLGDAAERLIKPAVRIIDKVAGTDLANCQGCTGPGGRKDRLNAAVPDIKHPFRQRRRSQPRQPRHGA